MPQFEHERLDVYRASIAFTKLADLMASRLPKGRAYLADQLRRAATSICLNIAEGAGEFAPADKARFYRMARRSANECSAILDICSVLELVEEANGGEGRTLLLRLVAMLTAMVLRVAGPDSDSDSGG